MKASDYIAQGRADFAAGKQRAGSTKAKNSWQENAYDTGYNAALRERAVATNGAPIEMTGEARSTLADAPKSVKADGVIKFKVMGIGQRFTLAGCVGSLLKLSDTEAGETDAAQKIKRLVRIGRNELCTPVPALTARPTPVSLATTAHIRTTQAATNGLRRMARELVTNDTDGLRAVSVITDNVKGKA